MARNGYSKSSGSKQGKKYSRSKAKSKRNLKIALTPPEGFKAEVTTRKIDDGENGR